MKPEYLEATPLPDVQFKDPTKFLPLDFMYIGAKPTAALAGESAEDEAEEQALNGRSVRFAPREESFGG
ncbi:hypothetical protein IscW_ISCW003795 [Ixodes scapularis]|uniref:Uncharacterized protein n=1 Tax=Ixodes scapularis TaxID=6945 RepID=B7PIH1_IXOSC|nr:hypothetical protein IscW_ISCW003795 [Ixodes scapularis]|eukprot:XP_002405121.1 hypothetical protein IscW_ISCW003795 [Ixodes scapularis]